MLFNISSTNTKSKNCNLGDVTLWYQRLGLCIMGEYTVNIVTSQIHVTHVNDHHLPDGKTCSHHWILHVPFNTLGNQLVRHCWCAWQCCVVSECLTRSMHAHSPTASEQFHVDISGVTFVLIFAVDDIQSAPYNVLGKHLYYFVIQNLVSWSMLPTSKSNWCVIKNMYSSSQKWPSSSWNTQSDPQSNRCNWTKVACVAWYLLAQNLFTIMNLITCVTD